MHAAMREVAEPAETVLGQIVLYHVKEGDDAPELVPFPLCPDMETFAAIVTRSHARGMVDLMVLDPSRGPMPRWKVPFATEPRPGHWTSREGSATLGLSTAAERRTSRRATS
jgi:hypothetical protein